MLELLLSREGDIAKCNSKLHSCFKVDSSLSKIQLLFVSYRAISMEAAKPSLLQKHTLFFCSVSLLRRMLLGTILLLAYAAASSTSVFCHGSYLSANAGAEACRDC